MGGIRGKHQTFVPERSGPHEENLRETPGRGLAERLEVRTELDLAREIRAALVLCRALRESPRIGARMRSCGRYEYKN